MSKSKEEILDLLNSDPGSAIDEILDLLNDNPDFSNLSTEFLADKVQYNSVEQDWRNGQITYETRRIYLNKVNLNLINKVRKLPSHIFGEFEGEEIAPDEDNIKTQIGLLTREISELGIRLSQEMNPDSQSWIRAKRHLVATQALGLIDQYKVQVSTLEYNLLAGAFQENHDYEKAEELYKRGVGNIHKYTDSVMAKITTTRNYAGFLFSQNRAEDGVKELSGAMLEGNTDFEYSINGYTCQVKFGYEWESQLFEDAKASYVKALEFFEDILNPVTRNFNISNLKNFANHKNVPDDFWE